MREGVNKVALRLFEHNEKAYHAVIRMMEQYGKAAIVHPTGTGKSYIAFKLIEDNPEKVVIWLSPSEYIFKTQLESLKRNDPDFPLANVHFYTYAKLMCCTQAQLDEIAAQKPAYIILDEFHRVGAECWGESTVALLKLCPDAKLLGLTATNIRYLDNNRDMAEELFDSRVASNMTLGEAVVRGILPAPKYVTTVYQYQKALAKYQSRVDNLRAPGIQDVNQKYLDALRRALEQADGLDRVFAHHITNKAGKYIVFCANKEHMDEMVSHVPEWFAGVNPDVMVYEAYGEKMPEETLLLVEDYIDGKLHVFDKDWPELPFAHREHIGRTVDYVAGRNRYMGYLISLGIYSFKGVKVGLDCANGASWNIAKSVFDALGADTYVINNKPNGLNINNNAGSTHIEGLQKFVVENGLDVGFAFDGDADRCLCVDEKGNVITGDHILYIYGCYMKEYGELANNTVVTTVMSNFGLYKAFDEQGIGYAKTAVGDKYVYEYMAKNGCRIGGEQSGHIIFSKYASTGDGILTSLKMMEVMLAKKMPMSKLAEPLKIYPQVLENVRVTDKKAAQNDPAVQAAVKAVAEALGDTGRILVRESGTEPVVRVMVEAPDHDTCQKYVSQVVETIKSRGYGV